MSLNKQALASRFAILSLCGFLLAAASMALIFDRHNAALLRATAGMHNVVLARKLGSLVMPEIDAWGRAGSQGFSAGREERLQAVIGESVRDMSVLNVRIHSVSGQLIYSLRAGESTLDAAGQEALRVALQGQVFSEQVQRREVAGDPLPSRDRELITSYVPVNDASGKLQSVIEIVSDVTPVVRQMEETRSKVAITVGIPLILTFLVLFAFVRRADKLIVRQSRKLAESNRDLEAEVQRRTAELQLSYRQLEEKVNDVKSAEARVKSIGEKLQQLIEIEQRLSRELDLDKLVPLAMTETSRYIGADRSSLFLFDWKNMELSAKFAEGVDACSISIPLRMGIVGTAILNRLTYNISNAYEHPYFNPELDQVLNFRTESILVAPVLDRAGTARGGIQLLNRSTGRFTPDDQLIVERAAAQLAIQMASLDEAVARRMAAELHQVIDCDRITVFRLDAEAGRLVSVYAEGVDREPISLGVHLGIAGLVAVTGQEVVIDDARNDSRIDRNFDATTGYVTMSMMCLPVRARKGDVVGVVQVINKQGGTFDPRDLEILRSLVAVIAVFIENAMLLEDQDRQFHSLLEVMAASIDAKDRLTAGHSHRVADIARLIARELGFSERELDVLKVAALLHDYGKIGVDDAVLKKEGKLTEEEYAHIRHHAQMTFSILDKIFFARKYRAVPLIAASHHEYLDGSGYPQGLTAKQIPFMSKVLTVADIYEALTADRHYRKGMGSAAALAILDEGVGTRFDPNVVAALQQVLKSTNL